MVYSLEADVNPAIKALEQFSKKIHKQSIDVGYETMSLWLNRITKNTPPFPNRNPDQGGGNAAKKAGEKAVEGAYRMAFFPVGRKTEVQRRNGLLTVAGIWNHQNRQRMRNGRLRPGVKKRIAHQASYKRALKMVKRHVGKLKAGWATGGNYYSRKSGIKYKSPAWVKRHSEAGSHNENIGVSGFNMTAKNKVWYASNNRAMVRTIEFTKKVTEKAMAKRMEYRANKAAKQFNKKVT